MPDLIIRVEFADESDFDYLRDKAVGHVREFVEDQRDDGRVSGKVEVSWDVED